MNDRWPKYQDAFSVMASFANTFYGFEVCGRNFDWQSAYKEVRSDRQGDLLASNIKKWLRGKCFKFKSTQGRRGDRFWSDSLEAPWVTVAVSFEEHRYTAPPGQTLSVTFQTKPRAQHKPSEKMAPKPVAKCAPREPTLGMTLRR